MMARQLRHCRHTLVALAFTGVAEMMMPCTLTRRDTWSDWKGRERGEGNKGQWTRLAAVEKHEGESRGGTLRLRMEAWWASLFSITWISCTASSPIGRGRVTSSATSFAASSSCQKRKHITHGSCCIIFTTGGSNKEQIL